MASWLRNMNISTRLMFIIIGINLLTLFLICAVAISSNHQSLQTQALEQFAEQNEQASVAISNELQDVQTIVNQLQTELNNLPFYSQWEVRKVINSIMADKIDVLIKRIGIYRPASDNVADSKASVVMFDNLQPVYGFVDAIRIVSTDNNLPDDSSPLFATIAENRPLWFTQDIALGDNTEASAMSLAISYDYGDDASGVVWVDIPQSLFDDMIDEQVNRSSLLTENGMIALVDQNGRILSHIGEQAEPITSAILQEMAEQDPSDDSALDNLYHIENPQTGKRDVVSVRTISANNWQLISLLPRDNIPTSASVLAFQLIILSVSGIGLMLLAMNYFTKRAIVEPLMNLSNAAQEIGSGDLRYHIGYRGYDDEIGFLARAMEGMKGNIAHSYNELRTWSRTLEERVYERTKELNATRKEAEQTAQDLQAVYDESLNVVNEPMLEPILEALVHRILSLLDASYCSVWLLDETHDYVRLVNNTQEVGIKSFVMPATEGMVGDAINKRMVLTVEDYSSYTNRVTLPYQQRDPYVRAMVAPMMFDGNPMGALVVGRDAKGEPFTRADTRLLTLFSNLVSPAIRNAQLFNQREEARREAERANQVKTRFLASVTHELRTPLNLIINNMDFMRIGAFGDVSDEQVSRLNQTVRSAEHLLYLINDLLDVSKIEAGEMQLFIQPNDVYTIIEDTVDSTYAQIEKLDGKADKVELVINVEENLPKIPMDSRRIRQVITNLMSNAVKFTHEGKVTLDVKSVDTGIYFAVSDTGIGIPEDEKDILFEAFERTTQAKEQSIEGTGLGLPISQFLVQQHGGVIEVESVEGEGTTFMFTLPFVTPTPDNGDKPAILPATQMK